MGIDRAGRIETVERPRRRMLVGRGRHRGEVGRARFTIGQIQQYIIAQVAQFGIEEAEVVLDGGIKAAGHPGSGRDDHIGLARRKGRAVEIAVLGQNLHLGRGIDGHRAGHFG